MPNFGLRNEPLGGYANYGAKRPPAARLSLPVRSGPFRCGCNRFTPWKVERWR